MKAVILPGFDQPVTLTDDLAAPSPGEGEVLVRVRASSLNPVDNAIAAGMLNGMVDHEFPVVLGRDYAGVVEQAGAGVTSWAPGDEVFGFLRHAEPVVHDGTWAELILVPQDNRVARSPAGVDVAAAGAAPLAGITALAAIDALQPGGGDRVLIVGATGGVGAFAVQLAARAGAVVIAPGLAEDESYLRDLGAREVIERGTTPDGEVDAVLDLVSYGPDGFEANAAALKEGGRGASPIGAAGDGPGRANVMATPTPENLSRLAGLLADGTLRVPIQRTYELAQAAEGLQALATTHTQGKLALKI